MNSENYYNPCTPSLNQ